MSRLEGERGPRNRRESVAAFTRLLRDCHTNNSAQLRDDATAVASVTGGGDGLVGNRAVTAESPAAAAATSQATENSSALRRVLVRRDAAEKMVARLMGATEGSYMLSPDLDMSKIRLGREKPKRTPPCGAVRVLTATDSQSTRR